MQVTSDKLLDSPFNFFLMCLQLEGELGVRSGVNLDLSPLSTLIIFVLKFCALSFHKLLVCAHE